MIKVMLAYFNIYENLFNIESHILRFINVLFIYLNFINMIKKLVFTNLLFFFCLQMNFAQTRTITGKVTTIDHSPLPGVSVVVKNSTIGVATDKNGQYRLTIPTDSKTLLFSFIGMISEEVSIGNRTVVDAILRDEAFDVSEVVVVGYGTAKKVGTVVGSITQVSAEKLKNKPTANVFDALQGRVAGLQVYTNDGEPSSFSTIRLHGAGSLSGGTTPLYVMDGAPLDNNAMINFNSADFESVTVLKDASATSIYGSRAANGVIFITSKKGKKGEKGKISVNIQKGFSELANRDFFDGFMNTKQLTDFYIDTEYMSEEAVGKLLAKYPNDTDWENYYYKDNAKMFTGNIAFSGGSDKTSYYISGSYLDQDGLTSGSYFERYTLKANINTTINNWLKIGINTGGAYNESQKNPYGTNSTNRGLAMLAQPFYTPYDENGDKYPDLIPGWGRYNPDYLINKQPYSEEKIQLNLISYAEITPFKGFTFKTQGSIDAYDKTINNRRSPSFIGSLNDGKTKREFFRGVTKTITNTAEYKFNYRNDHFFTVLAGQEWIENVYDKFGGESTGQSDDRLVELDHGPNNKNVWSEKSEYAYLSYFGRIDYNFKQKYFIDFSLREDQSSRFGVDNRSAVFYATGAMWNAKKENFLCDNNLISSLNFKISYGTSGNSDIGNYEHYATVGAGTYNKQTGWTINNPGNKLLGWEAQNKLTIGAKFGLLEDQFRFNIEYYNRKTKDNLLDVPYPYTSGFEDILTNVGEIENKGIDVAIDFDVVNNKDYFITPYININYNKDKVTKLFQGRDYWVIPNTGICWVVGESISYFQPVFAGIDTEDGAPMWYVPGDDITHKNTDETTKDFNPSVLEQNTNTKLYAPLTGGFGFNAGYKGITIQADFSFAHDKFLLNNDRYFFENPNVFVGWNQRKEVSDYWKQKGDVTEFPSLNYQFTQFDNRLIEDASFIRLKNLTIGYSIPRKFLDSTKFFANAKIFFTARNLMTWTKYSGPDPEVDSNLTLGVNPNTRNFTGGIELTF